MMIGQVPSATVPPIPCDCILDLLPAHFCQVCGEPSFPRCPLCRSIVVLRRARGASSASSASQALRNGRTTVPDDLPHPCLFEPLLEQCNPPVQVQVQWRYICFRL